MLLHDSLFFTTQRRINETHYSPITIAHSPLFHSTLTLLISIFAKKLNRNRNRTEQQQQQQQSPQPSHVLSHSKYRFLLILTSNDFLLCLSSIISCVDEKYYFQALVARLHLCSLHTLIWKFTLHFIPLLTIFILFRYHYILNKRFPPKMFTTSALNQLLFTDLCILIPFVIAFSWSVDGLWLWGAASIKNFIIPTGTNDGMNETQDLISMSSMNRSFHQSHGKVEEYYNTDDYLPQQQIICHLQTNNNLNFTTRLIHLIEADYLLLFSLHFIGLLLQISLHIRLSCCLIARKISPSFLREQQLSLYILYIFTCLTLTSIPFYFYRTIEILFVSVLSADSTETNNSRTLAQIILSGISFKPILYFILFSPAKFLFQFKCYTTIKMDSINQLPNFILIKKQEKRGEHAPRERYSLSFSTLYPKIQVKFRSFSHPAIPIHHHRSIVIEENDETLNDVYP